MKIAVYMLNVLYKFGGSECYTFNLIEVLQKIFPKETITLITESKRPWHRKSSEKLIPEMNATYGTQIDQTRVKMKYINQDERTFPSLCSRFKRIFLYFFIYPQYFKLQKFLYKTTADYDLFFNVSFKILMGKARKNFAVIHFPSEKLMDTAFGTKIPFTRKHVKNHDLLYPAAYDYFLPNSDFTSCWLKKIWNPDDSKIHTLYPPVTPVSQMLPKKENQIFICSRIERSKSIHELLEAYNKSDYLRKNTKVILAGSTIGEKQDYIKKLQENNPNIEFIFNPSRIKIEQLYAESSIYWHAKGYKEIEARYCEHFGITTVEAMSAGCIPIVFNGGGQKEIVTDECGFKWNTPKELIAFTEKLLKNPKQIESLRQKNIYRSKLYYKDVFTEKLSSILESALNKDCL